MSATPSTVSSNAQRRALILARVEAKQKEIWPDELPAGERTYGDFDALEALAARSGDTLARSLMKEGLREALQVSEENRPECCAGCGRKLQWSEKAHGLQTIRGPVEVERQYGYCRACEHGFFPLGGTLPAGGAQAKHTAAAGLERTGQRL